MSSSHPSTATTMTPSIHTNHDYTSSTDPPPPPLQPLSSPLSGLGSKNNSLESGFHEAYMIDDNSNNNPHPTLKPSHASARSTSISIPRPSGLVSRTNSKRSHRSSASSHLSVANSIRSHLSDFQNVRFDSEPVKDISFWGGVALLISNMTGPGLVTIPVIAQQAGWLPTLIGFTLVALLSVLSSLFICEAMTAVPGNDHFQANVEFSNLVLCFFGKRSHRLVQAVFFLAMQTTNIASIIVSTQLFDNLLIAIFHRTCGIEIYPNPSFVCVTEASLSASPFSGTMIISAGVVVALSMILPLGFLKLSENIWLQLASFGTILFIVAEWIVVFFVHGLDPSTVPVLGPDPSQTFGTILFNYAFITTVPSWANAKQPGVSIHKSLGYSVGITTVLYAAVAIIGGMAFVIPPNSSIIQAINADPNVSIISTICGYAFPIVALITSIPINVIVIRYNLIQSGVCNMLWSNILSGILPWFIAIPCMTGSGLQNVINWSSLFLVSGANFVIPFVLYIYSKKNRELISKLPLIEIEQQARLSRELSRSSISAIFRHGSNASHHSHRLYECTNCNCNRNDLSGAHHRQPSTASRHQQHLSAPTDQHSSLGIANNNIPNDTVQSLPLFRSSEDNIGTLEYQEQTSEKTPHRRYHSSSGVENSSMAAAVSGEGGISNEYRSSSEMAQISSSSSPIEGYFSFAKDGILYEKDSQHSKTGGQSLSINAPTFPGGSSSPTRSHSHQHHASASSTSHPQHHLSTSGGGGVSTVVLHDPATEMAQWKKSTSVLPRRVSHKDKILSLISDKHKRALEQQKAIEERENQEKEKMPMTPMILLSQSSTDLMDLDSATSPTLRDFPPTIIESEPEAEGSGSFNSDQSSQQLGQTLNRASKSHESLVASAQAAKRLNRASTIQGSLSLSTIPQNSPPQKQPTLRGQVPGSSFQQVMPSFSLAVPADTANSGAIVNGGRSSLELESPTNPTASPPRKQLRKTSLELMTSTPGSHPGHNSYSLSPRSGQYSPTSPVSRTPISPGGFPSSPTTPTFLTSSHPAQTPPRSPVVLQPALSRSLFGARSTDVASPPKNRNSQQTRPSLTISTTFGGGFFQTQKTGGGSDGAGDEGGFALDTNRLSVGQNHHNYPGNRKSGGPSSAGGGNSPGSALPSSSPLTSYFPRVLASPSSPVESKTSRASLERRVSYSDDVVNGSAAVETSRQEEVPGVSTDVIKTNEKDKDKDKDTRLSFRAESKRVVKAAIAGLSGHSPRLLNVGSSDGKGFGSGEGGASSSTWEGSSPGGHRKSSHSPTLGHHLHHHHQHHPDSLDREWKASLLDHGVAEEDETQSLSYHGGEMSTSQGLGLSFGASSGGGHGDFGRDEEEDGTIGPELTLARHPPSNLSSRSSGSRSIFAGNSPSSPPVSSSLRDSMGRMTAAFASQPGAFTIQTSSNPLPKLNLTRDSAGLDTGDHTLDLGSGQSPSAQLSPLTPTMRLIPPSPSLTQTAVFESQNQEKSSVTSPEPETATTTLREQAAGEAYLLRAEESPLRSPCKETFFDDTKPMQASQPNPPSAQQHAQPSGSFLQHRSSHSRTSLAPPFLGGNNYNIPPLFGSSSSVNELRPSASRTSLRSSSGSAIGGSKNRDEYHRRNLSRSTVGSVYSSQNCSCGCHAPAMSVCSSPGGTTGAGASGGANLGRIMIGTTGGNELNRSRSSLAPDTNRFSYHQYHQHSRQGSYSSQYHLNRTRSNTGESNNNNGSVMSFVSNTSNHGVPMAIDDGDENGRTVQVLQVPLPPFPGYVGDENGVDCEYGISSDPNLWSLHAIPEWVPLKGLTVAWIALVLLVCFISATVLYDFIELGMGNNVLG